MVLLAGSRGGAQQGATVAANYQEIAICVTTCNVADLDDRETLTMPPEPGRDSRVAQHRKAMSPEPGTDSKAAQHRKVMLLRIGIITAAVGAGIGVATFHANHANRFPNEWAPCLIDSLYGDGQMAGCWMSMVDQPLVTFDVAWPQTSLDRVQIQCNTRLTPGGDCYKLIERHAPLISWGNQFIEPGSVGLLVSTSSLLVREMGLEPGAFSADLLRALTLGAFRFKPMLGVKFILDHGAIQAKAFRPDELAGMAATVLRNAHLPIDLAYLYGQPGCGGQYTWVQGASPTDAYSRIGSPECKMEGCFHRFTAGAAAIDQEKLGLHRLGDRPAYNLAGQYMGPCANNSVSDIDQLSGTSFLRDECGVVWDERNPSNGRIFAWDLGCISDVEGGNYVSDGMLCLLFFVFTAVLSQVISSLLVWVLRRHSSGSGSKEELSREIRKAFPAVKRVAEEEDIDVANVVSRSSSLYMIIEASLSGDLVDNFEDVSAGATGAAVHAMCVITVALPLHAFHYFHAVSYPTPGWATSVVELGLLLLWYSISYAYLVAYYMRRLPLSYPHIIYLYRWVNNFYLLLFFWLISMNCLWMLSAITYNQNYVITACVLIMSAIGFLFACSAAASRFSKLQHKQPTHVAAYSVSSGLLAQHILAYSGSPYTLPAGTDPVEHLKQTRLRPALTPVLTQWGASWEDAEPALASVTSIEHLGQAIVDPAAFLDRLQQSGGAAAQRLIRARLRTLLLPLLAPNSHETTLTWEDVRPSVELLGTVEELREALGDPRAFLQNLTVTTATSLGKRWLINQLNHVIEPYLEQAGLAWDKIQRVIEMIDTVEEIKEAIADPEGFLQRNKQVLADEENRNLLPVDVDEATKEAGTLMEAAQAVGSVSTIAIKQIDKLELTRKQVLHIFAVGGIILVLCVGLIMMGGALWSRTSDSTDFTTLIAPLTVIATKVAGDKKIDRAERESTAPEEDDDAAVAGEVQPRGQQHGCSSSGYSDASLAA